MENKKGVILVGQPESGGILAAVSSPDYSPDFFTGLITESDWENIKNNPEIISRLTHGCNLFINSIDMKSIIPNESSSLRIMVKKFYFHDSLTNTINDCCKTLFQQMDIRFDDNTTIVPVDNENTNEDVFAEAQEQVVNKRDLTWYSCWKPLNTQHKFVYKSSFNKRIELKSIFKQIINASRGFK